jgi:hypothetical protein
MEQRMPPVTAEECGNQDMSADCRKSAIPRASNLVPNNVNLLAAINPRSDGAAETRLYLASPVAVPKQRRTRVLSGCNSTFTEIFAEIDRALMDLQQRFARRSFSINHVVAFELIWKKWKNYNSSISRALYRVMRCGITTLISGNAVSMVCTWRTSDVLVYRL